MDDFTPPSPASMSRARAVRSPPPIPPPPSDLPYGYRASQETWRPSTAGADSMPGGQEELARPPTSPSPRAESERQRRGSFGFLSRKVSRHEVPVVRDEDGHTMLRKWKLRDEHLRQKREERESRQAPTLPSHKPLKSINGFDTLPDPNIPPSTLTAARASNFSRPYQPAPISHSTSMPHLKQQNGQHQPVSPSTNTLTYLDPRSPTSSMNGKHYSLSSNGSGYPHSPRRMRRRKDPTPFNIMVVGAKGSGKTSMIDFLKTSLALPPEKQLMSTATPRMTTTEGSFTSHFVECELERERIGLTLWDSQGLEKNMVDLQVREMVKFIEARFEDTFMEESKVMRSPASKDSHIHCVFLILDPANLDATVRAAKVQMNGNAFAQAQGPAGLAHDLDMQVMKGLAGKTTVIPIISKADTLTGAHMQYLKRSVWNSIQSEKLDPLDALDIEDEIDSDTYDDDDSEHSPLPIQSPSSSISGDMREYRHPHHDDSDGSEGNITDMSPVKTRSSATTPSPAQPNKRHSRLPSRAVTPGEPTPEEMYIPFSLLSPDPYELNAVGRRFAWGMADPFNPDHCDFVRLRDSIFAEWRDELRSAAKSKWYEAWRTSRLASNPQRTRQAGMISSTAPPPAETGYTSGGKSLSPMPYQTGLGVKDAQRPLTASAKMQAGKNTAC